MRKQLPRLVMIGALLSPSALYALGLGELKLNSALNQPFDAEIELIAPTSEELAELKVALASNEKFARYGLERQPYLSNFEFAVTRNRDGRSAIKITSSSSVTEPFVTLLVEVMSGRGTLLREYTVLLDPPVLLPSQPESAAPVTPPQAGPQNDIIDRSDVPSAEVQPPPEPVVPVAEPTPAPEPVAVAQETVQQSLPSEPPPEQVASIPTPIPAPEPTPAAPIESVAPVPAPEPAPTPVEPPAASGGGSYVVQRNDTLFRIARDVRPDATKTRQINQTMIALFRANPAAFRGDNINQLRAGSVLRLPDSVEIEAIPATEASAEVRRQAQAWRGALSQVPRVARGDRLVLRTPPEKQSSSVAATPKAQPDSPRGRPGADPTGDDRRMALENEALGRVQGNLDEKPRPVPQQQTAIEQPPAQPVPEPEPEPTAALTQPEEQQPPLADPASVPGATQPGILDRAADFWWVPIVAGLLVGLVGLIAAFLRRRRAEPDLGDALDAAPLTFEPRIANEVQQSSRMRNRGDAFAVPSEPDPQEEETAFGGQRERPTVFREEPVARSVPEPVAAPAPVAKPKVVPPPQPRSVEDTLSSETAVRFDQQDALAEADFHMAYGLYDQAADLVKIAIDREPNRRDLKLKLLEIYFVWGNRDLFLETANELHQTRDRANPGEWENILIMGRQIAPEEPMFKGDAGARVDLVDVNLEGGENRVDVDLFAAPEASRSDSLDLEFASGERAGPDSDLDYLLDETREERSREYDPLSRTQETPTIESPVLETGQTSRMRALGGGRKGAQSRAGSYEETTALARNGAGGGLRDDDRTQLAPSLGNMDRTMLAPRGEDNAIYIDQVDLSQGGDTVEQRRPGRQANGYDEQQNDTFADDVFGNGGTNRFERIDLDVGDSLATEDRTVTRQSRTSMELSELEPVTMSEVGTKLDLARAYMDMGDPDGARSILEEVVEEGNMSQKQEAQRLLESVR